MKKLFTLVAMAFMAIGASAQAVIHEEDWTQKDAFDHWASSEGTISVTSEGLVIEVASEGDVYWAPQVQMVQGFELEELGNYQVVFTAKVATGTCRLDMGSWASSVSKDYIWEVEDNGDFQEFTVDFPDYPGSSEKEDGSSSNSAFCFIQCGKMVGTTIVKKCTVIDLDAEATGIKNLKNKAQNNVRYNLAGQQVDANYKGAVIMNGKKYIQK